MVRFGGQGILLDIEGTTSSISFVYDAMFPYVREHLQSFLKSQREAPDLIAACERIAADAGDDSLAGRGCEAIAGEVLRLMDRDVKATGLKQLQGLIWRDGFESGQLVAHVYDDVVPALEAWNRRGLDVRVYSSGSVTAQKLFFGHTERGDLLAHFNGHYDTTLGPKKQAGSYRAIAAEFGIPASGLLFVSDSLEELTAAQQVGMVTALSIRPGNPPVEAAHGHPEIESFAEISIDRGPGG